MKSVKMVASLLVLSTICASDLYAATIHVPADFPTISSAIMAANSGDTIMVAAGVYNEHVVVNKPYLTILGAQANVDARTRTYIAVNESIITLSTPAFGTGIVSITAPNIIFNGFTVQGSGAIVNSTAAIFAGDPGTFLPSTTTIDVTGLQILNNIVQNNANGIMVASIEPSPKTPNYLVQYNYFQNNSGDAGSGNGQGAFFNNASALTMTNVTVTDNLFNGMETSASVNLSNVTTATVSNNVVNQDNSIALFGTTGVSIAGNVASAATGDAIFVGFGSSATTITGNLIYNSTSNGINIFQGNSNVAITNNCISGSTLAGISLGNRGSAANSTITINNNNIRSNTTGLNLGLGSYESPPPLLDATSNYWNTASGPNYNGAGPGAGDSISDNNIAATQTVQYTPFLTNAMACPANAAAPDLTIAKTHTGSFTQGQTGTYTLTISNVGKTATSGMVTAVDTLPTGLTAGSIGGTGWSCNSASLICTRSDVLAAGSSYPAITVTVNVASDAPASVTNTATVSGGGETNTSNDSASDPTAIVITSYTIGGNVGGATSPAALTLSDTTHGTSQSLSSSGAFTFSTALPTGSNWSVAVTTPPSGQSCVLANNSGTNLSANVTNVQVNCTTVVVTLNPASLTTGTFSLPYSQQLSASSSDSVDHAPYTFTVASGTLPSGLTLSASGLLSGTPNIAGSSSFTVQAAGSGGVSGTRAYTLLVGQKTTIVSLVVAPNYIALGQSITITATVTGDPPTGTVSFTDNGNTLPCSPVTLVPGATSSTAVCTAVPTSTGSNSIVATYSGDGNYAGATSSAAVVTVSADASAAPLLDRWAILLLCGALSAVVFVQLRRV